MRMCPQSVMALRPLFPFAKPYCRDSHRTQGIAPKTGYRADGRGVWATLSAKHQQIGDVRGS